MSGNLLAYGLVWLLECVRRHSRICLRNWNIILTISHDMRAIGGDGGDGGGGSVDVGACNRYARARASRSDDGTTHRR